MKLSILSLFVVLGLSGCTTIKLSHQGDPAGINRTSDYCFEADKEAQFWVCDAGPSVVYSVRGGTTLWEKPLPAPVATPVPVPAAVPAPAAPAAKPVVMPKTGQ